MTETFTHVGCGCDGRNEVCGGGDSNNYAFCRAAKTRMQCEQRCRESVGCISYEWSESHRSVGRPWGLCQLSTSCTAAESWGKGSCTPRDLELWQLGGTDPDLDVDAHYGYGRTSGFLVPITLLVVANIAAWVYNKLAQPGKLLYPTRGQTVPNGNPRLPTVVTEDDFALDSNDGKWRMIHVFVMLFPLWLGAIIGDSCVRFSDCIPMTNEYIYQPECCGELGPSPTNDGFPYLLIPYLIIAPFYFWECFRSHTASYLRAMIRDPDLFAPYIHQMTTAVPTRLSLFVTCSHTETHTSTDSEGNTSTSYESVTTHSSDHPLEWTSLKDASPFVGMSVAEVQDVIRQWTQSAGDKTILEINTNEVELADDGSLAPIRLALLRHYQSVDSSCTVALRIDGRARSSGEWVVRFRPPEYKSAQSIQVHELDPDPRKNAVLMAVISSAGFWLASILFLTIPYRIYFERFTAKLTLEFSKELVGVRVSATEPVKTVCNKRRAPLPPTSSQMEQMQQMPGLGAGALGAGFLANPAMAQQAMQMQAAMANPAVAQQAMQMQAAMANPAVAQQMLSMHMGATGLPADGQKGHLGLPAGGAMERIARARTRLGGGGLLSALPAPAPAAAMQPAVPVPGAVHVVCAADVVVLPPAGGSAAGGDGAPCTSCGHALRPRAKFCCECGSVNAVSAACKGCGESLAPGIKFCSGCGSSVEVEASSAVMKSNNARLAV